MSGTKPKNEFTEWIKEMGGYDYYISYFDRCSKSLSFKIYGHEVYSYYNDYLIFIFAIDGKSVKIVYFPVENFINKNSVIQKKLIHEYIKYFDLEKQDFIVTTYNCILVEKYIETVVKKINAGFMRYEELLSAQNITIENVGFARIEINNTFSLDEFHSLISAYNRLYSIIACVYELGYENALNLDSEELCCSHAMILESIHVASEGGAIAAGIKNIVSILSKLVNLAFECNEAAYKAHKAKIEIELAKEVLELNKRESVFKMINMLDVYMEKKLHNTNHVTLVYMENEINRLMYDIEKLQGTKHVNFLV